LPLDFKCTDRGADALLAAAAERELTRRFLEAACAFTLTIDDREDFERLYLQLRPLTGGLKEGQSGVLQGLYLMLLLVDNRLADFHCELQLLTEDDLQRPEIAFPVLMEQQLLVGNYDAILETSRGGPAKLPHPLFDVFMGYITDTVRENIAASAEVAYESLSVKDACEMLMLQDGDELRTFIEDYHEDWIVDAESKRILFKVGSKKATIDSIPRLKLVEHVVGYATELERIV